MRERRWDENVESRKVLTGFLGEPNSRPELVALLDEAGLELWQAPEGFWAIRVKPMAVPTPPAQPARRRRLEGQA
jgi:hypothetical protein